MRVVLLVIALALPAPALAQDTPPELLQPAPIEQPGTVEPTDGGRSEVLLALSLLAAVGAGALGALALRRRPAPAPVVEPEPEPAPVWHPRVKSDLPPLSAFGSGPEPPAPH
jgi:hypothetical protein